MKPSSERNNAPNLAYPRTGKRGVPQQFPRRLYEMLEAETNTRTSLMNGNQMREKRSIIEWSESGRAFRIADIQSFATHILPKYFRTSKFSSFQRNLNLYGFTKVRRGPDTDMYAHPSFLRGYPQTLSQLRKSTSSATTSRKGSISSVSQSNYRSSLAISGLVSKTSSLSQLTSAMSPLSPKDVTQVHKSSFPSRSSPSNRPLSKREIRSDSFAANILTPSMDEMEEHQNKRTFRNGNSSHPDFSMLEKSACYPKGGKLALLTIAMTAIGDCE